MTKEQDIEKLKAYQRGYEEGYKFGVIDTTIGRRRKQKI